MCLTRKIKETKTREACSTKTMAKSSFFVMLIGYETCGFSDFCVKFGE
jgi:hypothetical protein